MTWNSKTAGRSAKRTEIWDSWVVVTCARVWGIFNLLVFKIVLESFGACHHMTCNSKMAGRRAKMVGYLVHLSQNGL